MFRVITIAALLLLVGCESQFDKCFDAELVKIKDSDAQEVANHPVMTAYAEYDKYSDQMPEYYRTVFEAKNSIGPIPEKCKSPEGWDDDCRVFRDARLEASKKSIEQRGLSHISSAHELFGKRVKDYVVNKNDDNNEYFDEAMAFNESLSKKYKETPDTPERAIELSLEYDSEVRNYYVNSITAHLSTKEPEKVATDVCNQRGLYD